VHANPEPSSANRTGYYVESANAHPLPIAKLGHFTAHIYCVHTITLRGLDRDVTEQKLDLIQFAAGYTAEPALPSKSAITQCSSLNWIDSTRSASSSPRRSPHPMSMASRVIPLAAKRAPLHAGEQSLALVGGQPVPHPNSDPALSFHSSDSGGQFRTEQTGVGSLKSNPPDRRQSEIDRRGRVLLLLEIRSCTVRLRCG